MRRILLWYLLTLLVIVSTFFLAFDMFISPQFEITASYFFDTIWNIGFVIALLLIILNREETKRLRPFLILFIAGFIIRLGGVSIQNNTLINLGNLFGDAAAAGGIATYFLDTDERLITKLIFEYYENSPSPMALSSLKGPIEIVYKATVGTGVDMGPHGYWSNEKFKKTVQKLRKVGLLWIEVDNTKNTTYYYWHGTFII